MTTQHISFVTGGAGFIGSHLVDHLLKRGDKVIVLDKLTYAGNLTNLEDARKHDEMIFVEGDICDTNLVLSLLKKYDVNTIFHLAAESHVDNSIHDATPFIETNIIGTHSMLNAALSHWEEQGRRENFRFLHISTDEVFGHLGEKDAPFTEQTAYMPNSPYSASKASSDHLARAWNKTYSLPVIICNCSNNYGSRQHREKLIPVVIRKALAGDNIPIYGNGQNIRDWLYVSDHCDGLIKAAEKGALGEVYCIGGGNEMRNIDLAQAICTHLDSKKPKEDGASYADQITFVEDRKGHDWRYAIDCTKAEKEIGYRANASFEDALKQTIASYLDDQYEDAAIQSDKDLSTTKHIDLAKTPLNYERFRQLARNKNLTDEERIGFPVEYRRGFEGHIIADITAKLDNLDKDGGTLLDIGCGASPLTDALLKSFDDHGLNVTLNDSDEMLEHITAFPNFKKQSGLFPNNLNDVLKAEPNGFDYILCYSVLHYIYVDSNIFDFTDAIMMALKPGGVALIGDIPNISKRKRFFNSETGVKFHQNFMKTTERPTVNHLQIEREHIDDAVLKAMVSRAHNAGYDAYILPQGKSLPMQNRRDDLIIRRP